jgi:hypothetical protein
LFKTRVDVFLLLRDRKGWVLPVVVAWIFILDSSYLGFVELEILSEPRQELLHHNGELSEINVVESIPRLKLSGEKCSYRIMKTFRSPNNLTYRSISLDDIRTCLEDERFSIERLESITGNHDWCLIISEKNVDVSNLLRPIKIQLVRYEVSVYIGNVNSLWDGFRVIFSNFIDVFSLIYVKIFHDLFRLVVCSYLLSDVFTLVEIRDVFRYFV